MIVIYTAHGCASCRKAKTWLKENNIGFIEKNIFKTLLDKNEIKYLLSRTDNGTEDIISKRSKIIQEGKIDIEQLSIGKLVDFVIANPSVLRRPIILNDRVFQIGYDAEEIAAFLPENFRKAEIRDDEECQDEEGGCA